MEIKVLGAGCAKCKATYTIIEKVVKEHHLNVSLTKVDDVMELLKYNVMNTPAVIIDGEVKVKGYIPTEKEIKKILNL